MLFYRIGSNHVETVEQIAKGVMVAVEILGQTAHREDDTSLIKRNKRVPVSDADAVLGGFLDIHEFTGRILSMAGTHLNDISAGLIFKGASTDSFVGGDCSRVIGDNLK